MGLCVSVDEQEKKHKQKEKKQQQRQNKKKKKKKETVVLILGQSLNEDGTASVTLLKRLETAARVFRDEGADKFLVSGADVAQVGRSEASVMQELLVDLHGFEASDVIVEDQAIDTIGNFVRSVPLLKANAAGRVLLVTSAFHEPRAMYALRAVFDDCGLPCVMVEPRNAPSGLESYCEGKKRQENIGADHFISTINEWDLANRLRHERKALVELMPGRLVKRGIALPPDAVLQENVAKLDVQLKSIECEA